MKFSTGTFFPIVIHIEKLCDKNIAIQGMEKSFKDKKKVKGTWE